MIFSFADFFPHQVICPKQFYNTNESFRMTAGNQEWMHQLPIHNQCSLVQNVLALSPTIKDASLQQLVWLFHGLNIRCDKNNDDLDGRRQEGMIIYYFHSLILHVGGRTHCWMGLPANHLQVVNAVY